MNIIEKRTFNYETVVVDGHMFVNCVFVGCTFHYSGGEFAFCECSHERCLYFFYGPAKRTRELIETHGLALTDAGQPVLPDEPKKD